MTRHAFLTQQPLVEARAAFLGAFDWIRLAGTGEIDSAEALGRVTAAPVFAVFSSPGYAGAAVDGYAVAAENTYLAAPQSPVTLVVGQDAFPVNTGHPLPPGTDAVVMIESVHQPEPGTVELRAAAFPWQHVRRVGEDIVAGELLFPHHEKLGATDVAALLTAGVFRLPVLSVPRVAVIPTGAELVDWRDAMREPPMPGRILETNSVLLSGLVRQAGGAATVFPRCPDSHQSLRAAVLAAVASDAHLVVVNAGASAGSEDHTVHVLSDIGRVLVHGIAAMPGKPTILAEVQGKPVVGSPGYPVSAWVCFDQFIGPALARMQGQPEPRRDEVPVVGARRMASRLGQDEFVRVHLGRVGDQIVASPLRRGAGAITSLARADGVLRIEAASEGLDEGKPAVAELLRPRWVVERTLVIVGSHDVTLDLLADHLRRLDPTIHVSSSNLGSLAGLLALRDGRCHLGGTHLLDPSTGDYNVSDVKKYLAGKRVRLVTLAMRAQGLIVKRGNPLGSEGWETWRARKSRS